MSAAVFNVVTLWRRSKVMREVVKDQFDAEFVDKLADENLQTLYDVILAANYMDIKSLLYIGCAKVAALIKGRTLDKLKGVLDPKSPENTKRCQD